MCQDNKYSNSNSESRGLLSDGLPAVRPHTMYGLDQALVRHYDAGRNNVAITEAHIDPQKNRVVPPVMGRHD